MKIRQGFVSNSSSTSFCLLGVFMDYDDFKKLGLFDTDEMSSCEVSEAYGEHFGKGGFNYFSDYEDCSGIWVGIDAESFTSSEYADKSTNEMKKEIIEKFKELGIDMPEKRVKIHVTTING